MELFLSALVAGVSVGAIYGLVAVTYTVIYSSTGIFNVAQGDLVMVGILTSYFALDRWNLGQFPALLLVLVVVVGISLIEERIAVRPFLSRPGLGGIGWFIATLGFSLILETGASILYGNNPPVAIPSPFGTGAITVGELRVTYVQVSTVVLLIIVVLALEFVYRRTLFGIAMRATAEDRDMAAMRGVHPTRISRQAFVIAGALSALAGFTLAPIVLADVTIGLTIGLKAFVALAVGGFGSLRGAAIAGLTLGIGEQLVDLYLSPDFEILTGVLLLLLVLIARPNGLFSVWTVRDV